MFLHTNQCFVWIQLLLYIFNTKFGSHLEYKFSGVYLEYRFSDVYL